MTASPPPSTSCAFPDRFTHEFFIKGLYPERAVIEEVH